MGQKPLLPPEASPITDHPALSADNAVTRYDDGDRVVMVGLPDCPGRPGHSKRYGHLPIGSRQTERNSEETSPDFLLKGCSLKIKFQSKDFPMTSKIFIDLRNGIPQNGMRPILTTGFPAGETERPDALFSPDNFDRPDRRMIISAMWGHVRQYLQLVRSAPGGADILMRSMILGICI